jgi:hypothetical protein
MALLQCLAKMRGIIPTPDLSCKDSKSETREDRALQVEEEKAPLRKERGERFDVRRSARLREFVEIAAQQRDVRHLFL